MKYSPICPDIQQAHWMSGKLTSLEQRKAIRELVAEPVE